MDGFLGRRDIVHTRNLSDRWASVSTFHTPAEPPLRGQKPEIDGPRSRHGDFLPSEYPSWGADSCEIHASMAPPLGSTQSELYMASIQVSLESGYIVCILGNILVVVFGWSVAGMDFCERCVRSLFTRKLSNIWNCTTAV